MNWEDKLLQLRVGSQATSSLFQESGSSSQKNLFQNALDGFTRALEPLSYFQQLTYGTAIGLRTGEWDRFRRTLRETAAYAPFGSRPTLTHGSEVADLFGVKDENARKWIGLGLDLFADPLMAGTVLRVVGKGAKLAKLGIGDSLIRAGNKLDEAISVKSLVEASHGTRLFSTGEALLTRVLDAPVRIAAWKRNMPNRLLEEDKSWATVGEIFLGRYIPGASSSKNPSLSKAARQITGGEEWGAGVLDYSRGAGEEIRRRMMETLERSHEKFAALDPSKGMIYRKLDEATGALLKDLGETGFAASASILDLVTKKDFKGVESAALALFSSSNKRKAHLERLQAIHKLMPAQNKINFDDLVRTVDRVAADGYAQTAIISHRLTGYDDWLELIKDTVKTPFKTARGTIFVTMDDVVVHKWLKARGEQSLWDNLLGVAEGSQKNPPTLSEMVDDALETTYRTNLDKYSTLRFAAFQPSTYLKGLTDGYMRRTFATREDPDKIAMAIKDGLVYPFKKLDKEKFENTFSELFGVNVGIDIGRLIDASSTGRIVLADVLEILQRHRKSVDPDKVKSALRTVDPDNLLVEETLGYIDKARKQQQGMRGKSQLAINYSTFKEREHIQQEAAEAMMEIVGFRPAMAQLSMAASPAGRVQDYLSRLYDILHEQDLIIDPVTAVETGLLRNQKQTRAVIDGVDMVRIPSDGRIWGGFAGKMIPAAFAREMMTIAQLPATRRESAYQKVLSMVRRAYLAPLPTAMRNALGTLGLLHTAGVPLDEMALHLKAAHKILRDPSQLGEAQHILHYLSDGSLPRSINDEVTEYFNSILSEATRSKTPLERIAAFTTRIDTAVEGVLDRGGVAGDLAKAIYGGGLTRPTESPLLGGFLRTFQYFEDVTRTAVYLWAKNKLSAIEDMDEAEVIRRAAHLANNATYDYTSVGLAVEALRKSGLGLFPAFAYFTVGRTAQTFYRRPALLAQQEKVVSGINTLMVPEPEERDSIDAMLLDYWAMQYKPLVVPQGNGEYMIFPTNYMMPHGMISAGETENIFWDMVSGGAWRPLFDLAWAWQGGPRGEEIGRPSPATQRYQQEIFSPDEAGTLSAVGKSAGFLASAYAPGTWARTIFPMWYKIKDVSPEQRELLEETQVKYFNVSPEQVMFRLAGVPGYTVGGQVTYRQQMAALRKDENYVIGSLRQQIQAAAILGNQERVMELTQRLHQVQTEYAEKRTHITQGLQGTIETAPEMGYTLEKLRGLR